MTPNLVWSIPHNILKVKVHRRPITSIVMIISDDQAVIRQEVEDQDDGKYQPSLNDDSGSTQDLQAARVGTGA